MLELCFDKDLSPPLFFGELFSLIGGFEPLNTLFSKKIISLWSKYYTSDAGYIKGTQTLLKGNIPELCNNIQPIEDILYDIQTETRNTLPRLILRIPNSFYNNIFLFIPIAIQSYLSVFIQ